MKNKPFQTSAAGVLIGLIVVVFSWPDFARAGTIVSWGLDHQGQVSDTPTESGFTAIAAGGSHSLALRDEGSIVSWGWDDPNGQVSDTPTESGFTAIAGGYNHSLALTDDGTIVSWGYDGYGLVSDTPTDSGFTAIASGAYHSLALTDDGTIVSWGYDGNDTPAENGFTAIAAGYGYSLALRDDGSIVSWGRDDYGQVSDTPTESGFTAIAAGEGHSLALSDDGSIVSWGRDHHGQVSDTPTESGFTAIAAGAYHSLALRADGSIVSWGWDYNDQVISDTPAESGFTAIAGGGLHSLALVGEATGTEILLGTAPIRGRSGSGSVASEVLLKIGYPNQYGALTGPSWWVNNSHSGQTFYVTETHQYFDWMVTHATNGADDYLGHFITFPMGGGGGALTPESIKIEKAPGFENEYPDFFGYTITKMALTLENLAIYSDGDGTHAELDATLSFYYGIPASAPPVADADGPYSIYVGDTLTLDANGSTDDDNDIVSYMWDLDDDENFETDAGEQAVFEVNYSYLESLGLLINYTYTIGLKVTDSEGQSDVNDSTLIIKPAVEVAVDIKPGSCPNPVNVKSSGVLPIAILGTDDVNVIDIVIASIRLADPNVAPIRNSYEDVAAPVFDANDCNCTTDGPDGFLDLTLKFETQRIVEAIGEVNDSDVLELELTGVLFDETPIEGADCILIRGRHKPINPADINKDGVVDTVDFAIFAQNWLQSSNIED